MEPGDDNLVVEINSRLLKFYILVNTIKCFLNVKVLNFLRIVNNTCSKCQYNSDYYKVYSGPTSPSLCHSVIGNV